MLEVNEGRQVKSLNVLIWEVTKSGKVIINFSNDMFLPISGRIHLPDEFETRRRLQSYNLIEVLKDRELILVDLIDTSEMDEPRNKAFEWKVASYTDREMII